MPVTQKDLLIKEWDLCEAGVSRYDTMLFTIKGWAITAVSAAVAFGFSSNDWRMPASGIFIALFFWFIDGTNKGFQRFFLNRSKEIQEALRMPAPNPPPPAAYAATPQIAAQFYAAPATPPSDPYWWRRLKRIASEMAMGNVAILYAGLIIASAAATLLTIYSPSVPPPPPRLVVDCACQTKAAPAAANPKQAISKKLAH